MNYDNITRVIEFFKISWLLLKLLVSGGLMLFGAWMVVSPTTFIIANYFSAGSLDGLNAMATVATGGAIVMLAAYFCIIYSLKPLLEWYRTSRKEYAETYTVAE